MTPDYSRKERWELKGGVIGEECILRTRNRFHTPVGRLACKRYVITKGTPFLIRWVPQEPNRYWSMSRRERGCIYHEGYNLFECTEKGANPFRGTRSLSKFWELPHVTEESFWRALGNLFWICGKAAYTHLPGDWAGSCTIGVIKPSFSCFPRRQTQG